MNKQERISAERLRKLTPSNVELLKLASQYPPPQKWYETPQERPFWIEDQTTGETMNTPEERLQLAISRCRGKTFTQQYGIDDAIVIADAYLASLPADDSEPVTIEWLQKLGWQEYGLFNDQDGGMWDRDTGLEWHEKQCWRIDEKILLRIPAKITRGQLRRLLSALRGE